MKRIFLIIGSSVIAACASGADPSDPTGVDKTQAIVLDCPSGWAKCVSTANKLCGPRGFDEVDRMQDLRLATSAGLERQGDDQHVYREQMSHESQQQVMVIRCR